MKTSSPALGSRALFPDLQAKVYAAHAAISPPSIAVMSAVSETMAAYARLGVDAVVDSVSARDKLKRRLSALFGGAPEGFAFTQNTSMGVLAIAHCFPWQRGDEIVLFEGEFPTNITPWLEAARRHDLKVHWLSGDLFRRDPERAMAAFHDVVRRNPIRLVAVSAVAFQTGFQMPLATLARGCHAEGAEIFVDAIQATGVVPLDFDALQLDYVAAGGHKWLMGPEGTGFVWIATHRLEHLEPNFASWLSHQQGLRFLFEGRGLLRYDRPMHRDASMLEGGMANVVGLAALSASVELIEQLGVEAIATHIQSYHDALEAGLFARGWRSLRAQEAAGRSGILSMEVPDHLTVSRMTAHLASHGVVINCPDGLMRFSPHWPNGMHEIDIVLAAVDNFIS